MSLASSLVVEPRFDPHVRSVVFDRSPLPIIEASGAVKFGHIDSQGVGESVNEHIDDRLVGQVLPSEVG